VKIELLYRELLALEIECGPLGRSELDVLVNLSQAYDHISPVVDRMEDLSGPILVNNSGGRPGKPHTAWVLCAQNCSPAGYFCENSEANV